MAYDPLSQSTRKTRTSLIIFATASICAEVFSIKPTQLPQIGKDIHVPELFLPLILGLGTTLLFASFVFYVFDDLKYRETPEALRIQEQQRRNKINDYKNQISHRDTMGPNDDNDAIYIEIMKNEELINNIKENPLTRFRLYATDVAAPLILSCMAMLGWLDQLDWLKTLLVHENSGPP